MIKLKKNMRILFQGDSVTDFYRLDDVFGLGVGYVRDAVAGIQGSFPELNIECINRGISGNRTWDLVERWDKDCIDIKPDVCSILIGVNDTWRRYDSDMPTTTEDFEARYRNILEKCRNSNIKCLLIQPFLLFTEPERKKWYDEDLVYKQDVVKKLADEFDCEYIPMHEIYQKLCKTVSPSYFAPDGVHPSVAGHYIMAKEVLKIFGID